MVPPKKFHRDVWKRDETGSNGCVVCSEVPACPKCPTGQTCVQSIQTCTECPKTLCRKSTTSVNQTTSANIGGIAGGVIAGILVIIAVCWIFYKFYFKKKLAFNKVQRGGMTYYDLDDDVEMKFHHNLPQDPALEKPSSRSSFATVFTRASNIIPIAYIPGVTIGSSGSSQSNNVRDSTVSDMGIFDSDIVGDRFSRASIVNQSVETTTAIRAKPKLITVSPGSSTPVQQHSAGHDGIPHTAVGVSQLGGVKAVKVEKKSKRQLQLQRQQQLMDDLVEEDEDDDYDPFIIEDDNDTGSVILEVEMDTAKSPFDDQFKTA